MPSEADHERELQKTIFADRLLHKYLGVWLWSILFGSTSGVVFSLTNIGGRSWQMIGLILIIPGIAAAGAAIAALLALYRGLSEFLLPTFFGSEAAGTSTGAPNPAKYAYYLRRAFIYLIVAAGCRLLASLVELLLNSFGSR
jgi:hypothetical protein